MKNKPTPLNNVSSKRLLAYATMAGASVAAFTAHANAEVIYTPIHANVNSNFFIDLDHDGLDDFRVYSYDLSGQGEVDVFGARGNRIVAANQPCGGRRDTPSAAPLPAGTEIGPGKPFEGSANCMAFSDSGSHNGPWFHLQHRYLGFAFMIEGKVHFGWARLSLGPFVFNNTATITGYAYETVAGKTIVAGDKGNAATTFLPSGTLGELALGASVRNFRQEGK